MIQVYRIPIPKDSLLKLPKEERLGLLQLVPGIRDPRNAV